MGQRHSRRGSHHSEVVTSSTSHGQKNVPLITPAATHQEKKPEPQKEKKPFRYEDFEKIPAALVEGPFEDFEIATDVYSTAYLIARNACPEMYSFSPIKNPQVRVVWIYLLFLVFSQLFVVISITVMFPPAVKSGMAFVDCQNTTSFGVLHKRGFLFGDTPEECIEAGDNEVAFVADAYGSPREFYKVEQQVFFYNAVLKDGSLFVYLLRIVCCAWVFCQIYFEGFSNVSTLLDYHDFSYFFIEKKGYTPTNRWAICFPLIQYAVLVVVACVSFLLICSISEAFDIVMNALAFTFITEVGQYFNEPLAKQLGQTEIAMPVKKDYTINYLYPEYRLDNFENPDGSYTDEGWYIAEDEEKAGLLSDYRVRHNPEKYDHPSQKLANTLQNALVVLPILSVIVGALRCRMIGATGVNQEL